MVFLCLLEQPTHMAACSALLAHMCTNYALFCELLDRLPSFFPAVIQCFQVCESIQDKNALDTIFQLLLILKNFCSKESRKMRLLRNPDFRNAVKSTTNLVILLNDAIIKGDECRIIAVLQFILDLLSSEYGIEYQVPLHDAGILPLLLSLFRTTAVCELVGNLVYRQIFTHSDVGSFRLLVVLLHCVIRMQLS